MSARTTFGVVTAPDSIRFERLLPGPVERVWDWLTQSDKRGQWLASGAMPAKVGGEFEMRFHHASLSSEVAPTPERYKAMENGHVSTHRVLRWDPPRLLAISWSDGARGESEVTFELTPQGDDVRLVLTQSRLAGAEVLRSVAMGWHTHLTILEERLNGRAPRAFWPLMAKVAAHYNREISRV
jgi:uncharacterized protein YndB with AHSA1/START domain